MTVFVHLCTVCNMYIYDPAAGDTREGISSGTTWEEVDPSFVCPICGAPKDAFTPLEGEAAEAAAVKYQGFLDKKRPKAALTLAGVREKSQEHLMGICSVNKVCDGDPSRLCMGQKYGAPIGLGGVGKGLAFTSNVESLDRVRLKMRLITDHAEPDLSTTIFGKDISLPVMASSLSGVKASMGGKMPESGFAEAILAGCVKADTIGLIGNTSDDGEETTGVEAVKKVGGGIPIFKPQANDRLIELIGMAEEAGAAAVGVDVDGASSTNWERAGKPVFRKSVTDLKELTGSTDLPFMVKGIMCAEDAEAAISAGAACIDVSDHGGRSLGATPGMAEVLPGIVEVVDGRVKVTAGGGVRTGFDALKMLALGADAVLLGRDIARAALGGGADGVKLHMEYVRSDLRRGMLLTSCDTVADIDGSILV